MRSVEPAGSKIGLRYGYWSCQSKSQLPMCSNGFTRPSASTSDAVTSRAR